MTHLKNCPFCGAVPQPAYRQGAICSVRCLSCNAEGPYVRVYDYLNCDAEITDELWNAAIDTANEEAAKRWNFRPYTGTLTEEELTEMEAEANGRSI